MTPIESTYDVRMVTLLGVIKRAIEELALIQDNDPDKLLTEYLYLTTKELHERGTDNCMDKLFTIYPLLKEAIR